jgi:cysteine desulfurase
LGGGQERNRRAGTENVAGIVGFAEAVKIANEKMVENYETVENLKKYFWDGILASGLEGVTNNSAENSSPYILSISFDPDLYNNDSEAILMYMDINGIAVSSGSACSSGTLKPSHVVTSAGYSNDYANGTIRFSFSPENTESEIDRTITVIKEMSENNLK